jgi:hypothetical protein
MKRLAAVLIALTAAGFVLCAVTEDIMGHPLRSWTLIGLLAASCAVYFAAVHLVLRQGREIPLWLVLGVAVLLRLSVIGGLPFLSSDIYRYVWDGMVQAAGINPYVHLPADQALAWLRDSAIYPNINRADYAPTIYPPAAQILFAAVGLTVPSVLTMKLAMVAFEALGIACLMRLLRMARLPAAQVLIYAWNPLAVWEFAANGHVDAMAVGLVALALLLRAQKRDGWAGVVFGAAVLVKFLPAAIGPALWRRGGAARLMAGGLATILALYAAYALWDGAGLRVLGFLSGYGAEEGLENGSGIWLLSGIAQLVTLPSWAPELYLGLVASGLLILALRMMARRAEPDIVTFCGDAAMLAVCLTLALSPHYAWYYGWLAVAACIRPSRMAVWLSAAPVLLYENPFVNQFVWPALVFVPALAFAWIDLRRKRPAGRLLPLSQGTI